VGSIAFGVVVACTSLIDRNGGFHKMFEEISYGRSKAIHNQSDKKYHHSEGSISLIDP
jgi:hypothetical protein